MDPVGAIGRFLWEGPADVAYLIWRQTGQSCPLRLRGQGLRCDWVMRGLPLLGEDVLLSMRDCLRRTRSRAVVVRNGRLPCCRRLRPCVPFGAAPSRGFCRPMAPAGLPGRLWAIVVFAGYRVRCGGIGGLLSCQFRQIIAVLCWQWVSLRSDLSRQEVEPL